MSLTLLLSLVGYVSFAIWFPFLPNSLIYPQLDILSFTPSVGAGLLYGGLVVSLFYLYGRGYRQLLQHHTLPFLSLILIVTLYAIPLFLTYPINATDIYRYVIRGRVRSVYGENQFEVPPAAFDEDPFHLFAGEWADETTPYGTVWELLATAVTHFTGNNLVAGILAFKFIGLLSHLLSGWLIWALLNSQSAGHRLGLTWLWLANPALLLNFIVNGHNDALMIFWLLLSLYLIFKNRPFLGMVILPLAPLTKPIALLALPFVFFLSWQQKKSMFEQLKLAAFTFISTLSLTILTFLPFGPPITLVQRLLRELAAGAGFSIMAFFILLSRALGFHLPLARVTTIGQIGLLLWFGWLLWQSWGGRSPLRSMSDSFAGYLVQAANFRIWYASWIFPWTLIEKQPSSNRIKTAVFFLLTTQLSVIIYAHFRVFLFNGDHTTAHLLGVPFTFLAPFLATYWHNSRKVS